VDRGRVLQATAFLFSVELATNREWHPYSQLAGAGQKFKKTQGLPINKFLKVAGYG
jgi:hypothetical protein